MVSTPSPKRGCTPVPIEQQQCTGSACGQALLITHIRPKATWNAVSIPMGQFGRPSRLERPCANGWPFLFQVHETGCRSVQLGPDWCAPPQLDGTTNHTLSFPAGGCRCRTRDRRAQRTDGCVRSDAASHPGDAVSGCPFSLAVIRRVGFVAADAAFLCI